MLFTLNINNILLLVFHEVLFDKYFKKNLATCKPWPSVPTFNLRQKFLAFLVTLVGGIGMPKVTLIEAALSEKN